jgi:hypothetical protein
MLIAAATLGVLVLAEVVMPWVLLTLVFAVGAGHAFVSPTWQTLQPELVAAPERQQAISLGAVNMNLTRAFGRGRGFESSSAHSMWKGEGEAQRRHQTPAPTVTRETARRGGDGKGPCGTAEPPPEKYGWDPIWGL